MGGPRFERWPRRVDCGAWPAPARRLADLFPAPSALPGRWEAVHEAPEDPSGDLDLVSWGVREKQARHYTWYGREGIRVCSAEIWAFGSEAQARIAEWIAARASP